MVRKLTNWEVYERLQTKLHNALPQCADDCDVSINEAHFDKFGKEYRKFHDVEHEEFDLEGL